MNPYLARAFELGQEKACRDFGLTKEAGPLWAGVKRFLPGLAMGLGGAGIGALMSPEDRARGALLGGLGGAGLYGGWRAARGLLKSSPEAIKQLGQKLMSSDTARMLKHLGPEEAKAVTEQFMQHAARQRGISRGVLGGVLGLGGLGAGLYAGSKLRPEQEKPGLFSLTPERVEGLKQLVPMATQLLPAMMQQQGQPPLPDLSGAASPGMAYGLQPEMPMSYPEMSGGYPQGMM